MRWKTGRFYSSGQRISLTEAVVGTSSGPATSFGRSSCPVRAQRFIDGSDLGKWEEHIYALIKQMNQVFLNVEFIAKCEVIHGNCGEICVATTSYVLEYRLEACCK